MSGVTVTSECTLDGRLLSYRLTASAVWPDLLYCLSKLLIVKYILIKDEISGEISVSKSLITSSVILSDWLQSKM